MNTGLGMSNRAAFWLVALALLLPLPLLAFDERKQRQNRSSLASAHVGVKPSIPVTEPNAVIVVSPNKTQASEEHAAVLPSTAAQSRTAAASEVSISDRVLSAVADVWPNDTTRAKQIVLCESRAGMDPDAWNVNHPDGGPMQINRYAWADYFLKEYGWDWEQVVTDLNTNLAAAREIYDQSGGWHKWACADVVLAKST